MHLTATTLGGVLRLHPDQLSDSRGTFYEAWRATDLPAVAGAPFDVRQVNFSVSVRGTVRGIHTTAMPPGQAKLVTCVRGVAFDVAVDLRTDSPTFGRFETTLQDSRDGVAVYLPDGVGHAFLALTDDTCMNYLCSAEYVPGTMIEIDPFDSQIGIPWDLSVPAVLSDKDRNAMSLAQARASGLLPTMSQCADARERPLMP